MLGLGLSLGAVRQGGKSWGGPASLLEGRAGHWSGAMTPPAFAPAAIFRAVPTGHWSGGFAPPAFAPSQIYRGGGAGHWSGDYAPAAFSPPAIFRAGAPGHWSDIQGGLA